MQVIAKGLEIRGVERNTNKKGVDYLLVHVEEPNGRAADLIDNTVDNEKYYVKGTMADIILNINLASRYTNVRISEIHIIKDDDKEVTNEKTSN